MDDIKWTQWLNPKTKTHFYNPIRQNKSHIKFLKTIIEESIPIFSLIVFSNTCNISKCPHESENLWILNRRFASQKVDEIMDSVTYEAISQNKVEKIHDILMNYTQVSEEVKKKHIADIKNKYNL